MTWRRRAERPSRKPRATCIDHAHLVGHLEMRIDVRGELEPVGGVARCPVGQLDAALDLVLAKREPVAQRVDHRLLPVRPMSGSARMTSISMTAVASCNVCSTSFASATATDGGCKAARSALSERRHGSIAPQPAPTTETTNALQQAQRRLPSAVALADAVAGLPFSGPAALQDLRRLGGAIKANLPFARQSVDRVLVAAAALAPAGSPS